MKLEFMSLCSGIEAASCAWEPLGWRAAAFSENASFPSSLLKHRFPHVPNLGDMTQYKSWPDYAIQLLCGGTPCQSYSVAGLRAGLADPRGDLMLTFGAIAARYRPEWLVWENVAGVLTSNEGRDFGTFLGLLGQLGYGFAYRILDAQFFGVAQRRRRVFVVGCLGNWRRAAAVLFERHSLQGHPAPRRKAGEKPAGTLSARSTGGGGLGTDLELDGGLTAQPFDIANCLTQRMHKGMNSDLNEGQTPVLAFPERLSSTQYVGPGTELSPSIGASNPTAVAGRMGVRRLTVLECERLQGFPGNWTAVPTKNRNAAAEHADMREYYRRTGQAITDDEIRMLAADGPRYKALGNSWAVPCAEWIGRRIEAVSNIEETETC